MRYKKSRKAKDLNVINIVNAINEDLGIDIFKKTRKREYIAGRMFLYYFLNRNYGLTPHYIKIEIEDSLDIIVDRGTVRNALRDAEYLLPKDVNVSRLVEANFPDLIPKGKAKGFAKVKEETKCKCDGNDKYDRFKKILNLLNDLNDRQLSDVEYHLDLKVKSYSWKTKDSCMVIEGYEKINSF